MTTIFPPRTRKRAPSDEEWDRIRPELERLYIHEGKTLPKISAILARDYGFHAELYMYKVRMAKWGLKKNFRLEDLEAAALTVSHFVQAGLNPPQPIINNRKVPISRAKRHFGALLKCSNAVHPQTTASSCGKQCPPGCSSLHGKRKIRTRQTFRRHPPTVPRVLLQQSADLHLFESTMATINNYFAWRLSKSDDHFAGQVIGGHTVSRLAVYPGDILQHLSDALGGRAYRAYRTYHDLRTKIRRELALMDEALLQQHHSLIHTLLCHYIVTNETTSDQLWKVVFSYLDAQAGKLLGQSHPISLILKMLLYRKERMGSSLVLSLMRDLARRQGGSHAYTVCDLEYTRACAIFEEDGFAVASELCQTLLQQYMDKYDEMKLPFRKLLGLWGEMNFTQGLNDVAEGILRRVVELDPSPSGISDWNSIYAMDTLGLISKAKGEFPAAKEWLSRACEASRNNPKPKDTMTKALEFEADQMERQLAEKEGMANSAEEELSEKDEAEVLEELETQIALMGLQETREFEAQPARPEISAPWDDDLRSLSTNDAILIQQVGQQDTVLRDKVAPDPGDSLQDLTQHQNSSHIGLVKSIAADDAQVGYCFVKSGQAPWRFQSTQSARSTQYPGDIHSDQHSFASSGTQPISDGVFSSVTIEKEVADAEQQLEPFKTDEVLQFRQHEGRNTFDDAFDSQLMDLDVQEGQVANKHDLDGLVTSLHLTPLFPIFAIPPYLADFESYTDSNAIMSSHGLGTCSSGWRFDGAFDLEPMDLDIFGDVETIDPKLIYPEQDAVGCPP